MTLKYQINNLVQIQRVDTIDGETQSPVALKTLHNNKGKAVFLHSTEFIKTVAVLEFIPGAGIRGNHYHYQRHERLYVIEGKLKLFLWLPDSPEIEERILESGDLVSIEPNLGHAYKAIDHSWAFEMATHSFDPADTIFDERIKESYASQG